MSKTFKEKWLEAVERKNSVLCAGLDPAIFSMGRGEKGLPEEWEPGEWVRRYIIHIAPFCAAIKPNAQYWKGGTFNSQILANICNDAHSFLDMLVIDDSKLADIGSTNDAGMFYAARRGADAVTLAPFAGNMKEAAEQAKAREIGLITMCLMSNPEYKREKNKLVCITYEENGPHLYHYKDVVDIGKESYVKQYIKLAHDAEKYGLDGVVIGAPSEKNHIKEEEISKVKEYVGDEMLVLLPGVGAQGGEANAIWKYFAKNRVIVNVGRSLMFPKGSHSTAEEQAEAAKHYRDMLNELRNKA